MRRAWTAAVIALGGRADEAIADDLVARYAESHRRYHTSTHIAAMLADLPRLAPLEPHEAALVVLAVCAHDVVYDARPGADERASAAWATTTLSAAGLTDDRVERVAGLVLATADHTARPDDLAAAVLLDADLAILGAPAAGYRDYVRAVRAEYAAVPDDLWRTGRRRVLTALADRDQLYRTAAGRALWAEAARANLAAELAELAEPPSEPPHQPA